MTLLRKRNGLPRGPPCERSTVSGRPRRPRWLSPAGHKAGAWSPEGRSCLPVAERAISSTNASGLVDSNREVSYSTWSCRLMDSVEAIDDAAITGQDGNEEA